jgi:hypothetical protein
MRACGMENGDGFILILVRIHARQRDRERDLLISTLTTVAGTVTDDELTLRTTQILVPQHNPSHPPPAN